MKRWSSYQIYLSVITALGLGLVAVGLWNIPTYDSPLHFVLLLLLASLAEASATSVRVSEKAGITFGVGTAVAMAALPVFGPFAAAVVVATINLGLWLIKPTDRTLWKKNLSQLGFNTGMHSIAIFGAGLAFMGVEMLFATAPLVGIVLAWLVAAIVNDQLNFWLVMGILRLQHGSDFDVFAAWRGNLWAVPINIAVLSAGGALLAYAAQRYDAVGILIFFVPIVLSAYAFRLYVRQMQDHLRKLEEIVEQRTAALAEHAARLEKLNSQKDTYISILSHDIKTALTSISVYNSLMSDYPNIISEEPQIVEDISHSLELVTNIVDNALDLERMEEGAAVRLNRERFVLDQVLHAVVESMRGQARHKEIAIECRTEPPALVLDADRSQIERVLMNVLSNAIKYTPRGGRITAQIWPEDDEAVVEIADTGYGIPPNELPTIFEKYTRIDNLKTRAAGTGLGLAISKAFVEAHQGNIVVRSREREGSVFTIRLPLAR